jgi:hypothetical protein
VRRLLGKFKSSERHVCDLMERCHNQAAVSASAKWFFRIFGEGVTGIMGAIGD